MLDLEKSEIIEISSTLEEFKTYVVYFLINKEEIVYVGFSKCYPLRVSTHLRDKVFNRYSLIKCKTEQEALDLEFHYIKKFKPKYNRLHNKMLIVVEDAVYERETESCDNLLPVKSKKNKYIPLEVYNTNYDLPNNSYEKKYVEGQFLWLFKIRNRIYSAKYAENKIYSHNKILIKPKKNKGTIDV